MAEDTYVKKGRELDELFSAERMTELHTRKKRLKLTPIAAALILGSGIFAIVFTAGFIIPAFFVGSEGGLYPLSAGVIYYFLGFSSLASGILTVSRRWFKIAFALAIPSIFILVFPGIIGMLMILRGEDEFLN
jgi:hypothetical protein